jgi:hypothetical protein
MLERGNMSSQLRWFLLGLVFVFGFRILFPDWELPCLGAAMHHTHAKARLSSAQLSIAQASNGQRCKAKQNKAKQNKAA